MLLNDIVDNTRSCVVDGAEDRSNFSYKIIKVKENYLIVMESCIRKVRER